MATKASKQHGKHRLLKESELKSLLRNKRLIGLILSIVLTAYPDQESPEDRKSMDFARKWLESLAREQIWLLLLAFSPLCFSDWISYLLGIQSSFFEHDKSCLVCYHGGIFLKLLAYAFYSSDADSI